MARKITPEFNEEFREVVRRVSGQQMYLRIMERARPIAGGKARHRKPQGPSAMEKLAIPEIRPQKLRTVDQRELQSIWLRLNQLFAVATRERNATEDIVNAAVFTSAEMNRRNIRVNPQLDLSRAVAQLTKADVPDALKSIEKLPMEVVVVPDFISLVGSAAKGSKKPNDIDILTRSERTKDRKSFLVRAENVWLQLRNVMDPNKQGLLNFIDNPQGAHGDHVPLFDLVLRRKRSLDKRIIKGGDFAVWVSKQVEIDVTRRAISLINPLEAWLDQFVATRSGSFAASTAVSAEEIATLKDLLVSFGSSQVERTGRATARELGESFSISDARRRTIEKALGDRARMVATESSARFREIRTQMLKEKPKPSLREMRRRMREEFDFGKDRAKRIARTEATMQVNMGVQEGYRSAGVDRHRWVTILDGQARASHSRTHGQVVKIGDQFRNGLQFPGDPKGPASEILNCRCITVPAVEKMEKQRLPTNSRGLDVLQTFALVQDKGAKLSKPESGFAEKAKTASEACGACRFYLRDPKGTESGLCQVVEGPIAWFATCQLFIGAEDEAKAILGKSMLEADPKMTPFQHVDELWSWADGKLPLEVYCSKEGRLLQEVSKTARTQDQMRLATRWALGQEGSTGLVMKGLDDTSGEEAMMARPIALPKQVLGLVPPEVRDGSRVVFVASSPSTVEFVHGRPLVGPEGEVFEKIYLAALGLPRSRVSILHAVPSGLVTTLDQDAVTWAPWRNAELSKTNGAIVVALGRDAKRILGDRAEFSLPHPRAVWHKGDRGEVARKMRQIKKALKWRDAKAAVQTVLKARSEKQDLEGGETRGARAESEWRNNWQDVFPRSGKGRFVYQHHWRGLETENGDETKMSERALMSTNNSLHGDIRFTSADPGELWGFATLIGSTQDNRRLKNQDKLIDTDKDIPLAPKLPQPRAWLTIASRSPHVAGPGKPGATSRTSAKLFELDSGTYDMGVWHRNLQEIFLDGKKLRGRFLIQSVPFEGRRRVWLIKKPADQRPFAETNDLEKVIAERKARRRKFLVWAKPGTKPKLFDVRTGREIKKELVAQIVKADEEKQIVYGVALTPYVVGDSQGDWAPPDEIEKAAHDFLTKSRVIGFRHARRLDAKPVESFVVQYPTSEDRDKAFRGEPHKAYKQRFGSGFVRSGEWVVGTKVEDKAVWAEIKAGNLRSYSIGGFGIRVATTTAAAPKVEFIEIG